MATEESEEEPEPVTTDYRATLVAAHQKSSEAYDKAVMTLAGGALGISVTFVHDIAPNPKHTGWLSWSWVFFAISLALIFVSFLASQYAIGRRIKEWDDKKVFPWNLWGMATRFLNLLSGAAFIAGVICLVRFAALNI
jgi:hypothetical protein